MFFFFKVSMLLKEEHYQNISTGRLNRKPQKCKCSYWTFIWFCSFIRKYKAVFHLPLIIYFQGDEQREVWFLLDILLVKVPKCLAEPMLDMPNF